jgi:hypothetical protein
MLHFVSRVTRHCEVVPVGFSNGAIRARLVAMLFQLAVAGRLPHRKCQCFELQHDPDPVRASRPRSSSEILSFIYY